jgi:hypothetical protein
MPAREDARPPGDQPGNTLSGMPDASGGRAYPHAGQVTGSIAVRRFATPTTQILGIFDEMRLPSCFTP